MSSFSSPPPLSTQPVEGAANHTDGAGAPDLRARLLNWYLLFAAALLILLLVGGFYTRRQIRTAQIESDLALARAFAAQIDAQTNVTESPAWIVDPNDSMLLIDEHGRHLQSANIPPMASETEREQWLRQVAMAARLGNDNYFTSVAPDGVTWGHARAALPSGEGWVVVQRPHPTGLTGVDWPIFAPFFAAALALAAGLLFWMLMLQRYITPLERLIDLSEVLRWRGHLRPEERRQLAALARQPGQVGRLAQSITALEAEIQRRFLQLTTLLQTSRVVAASLDTDQVLDSILVQVQTLFNVDKSAVMTLDERAGVFRIRASRGLADDYVAQIRVNPSEPSSPAMRALRNRAPVQVSNTETDLAFAKLRARSRYEGYRSVLAIPLQTHHAQPAVLVLYKDRPYRYNFGELELASSFAAHVSVALENSALYARSDAQLQEQTRRLEAIVESLSDGLVLEGPSGSVLYSNRRAAAILGLSERQMARLDAADMLRHLLAGAEDRLTLERRIERVLNAHEETNVDLTRKVGGQVQDLRIDFFNVTDARGQQLGRGQLWQDVTADKELDRMRSSLIATVSHELRTPLATIKGYASTLLAADVDWDPESQREFLEIISNETDRLAELVTNLLDLSRIEAGNLTIHTELYAINQIVRQVAEGFDERVRARLRLNLAPDPPLVRMDAARINTVIRNLIDNSVRYSPPDAYIDIATAYLDGDPEDDRMAEDGAAYAGRVQVTVRDYGSGIPTAWRERVFERFFRGDDGLTRRTGGVGLGLAICKGFVEAHNGRIWLADAAPGAVIGFSLPAEQDDPRENDDIEMTVAEVAVEESEMEQAYAAR
jgi:PAS domain S-box-containing protein